MACVFLLSYIINKEPTLDFLTLSAGIILSYNPLILFDIGFIIIATISYCFTTLNARLQQLPKSCELLVLLYRHKLVLFLSPHIILMAYPLCPAGQSFSCSLYTNYFYYGLCFIFNRNISRIIRTIIAGFQYLY